MMGGVDGGLMLIAALACALPLLVGLVAVAYFGLRGRRPAGGRGLGGARELLERRLAGGEIGVEEFYERESALRSAEPVAAPRARRWP
jgi:uncharacterized membrane protein